MLKTLRLFFSFLYFLIQRMLDLRMAQAAASLTFTTLLALVPLLTVALIIVSAFPVFGEFAERFKVLALGTLVPEYADKVADYINEFISNVGNLTAVGVILLSVTALMLMRTIEDAFNDIWGAPNSRPLMHQLLIYWMVLTLGPLLIGIGFTLWRWLHYHFGVAADWPMLAHTVNFLTSWAMTTAVLWLIYRVVPNRYVPSLHALIGALLAGLLIEAGRYAFSYYVGRIASYQLVYGAFASLPVFLLWLFCLWLIVLGGAIIAASMSYWRGTAWKRPTDIRQRFLDVIEILLRLYRAQEQGKTLQLSDLRKHVHAGDDELMFLTNLLTRRGLVLRGREGWVLKRSAATLPLIEILRLFVDERGSASDNVVGKTLHHLLQPTLGALDISLEAFARQVAQQEEMHRPIP